MKIIVKEEVAKQVGYAVFEPYGASKASWGSWRKEQDIDLAEYSVPSLEALQAVLQSKKEIRGVPVLLADIKAWLEVLGTGPATKKARTVRHFESFLQQFLVNVPGHRIYARHDEGAMLAYYVSEIVYQPPLARDNTPAMVTMKLLFERIGGVDQTSVTFLDQDCRNIPVAEALAKKGFQVENNVLRADYLENKDLFQYVSGQVGKQYWARGFGTPALSDRFSTRGGAVNLERAGSQTRSVVDVFFEDGKQQATGWRGSYSAYFWPNIAKKTKYDPLTDTDSSPVDEDMDLERPEIEVPVHPWVIIFDLARHVRLQVHVRQLEEYIYDENLAEKLVLPQEQKDLVKLLIDTKDGVFQDIVQGKGGGAVILLSGLPGTGKTLTAEVYAESEQRALYSVQCSQLGTDPEKLEGHLLTIFERAARWNAVMLLDEADVYVHERGYSMEQNAIVGVFLRVLEYQATILFLTTNRPDDVDDAIASRCIARIPFVPPGPEDSTKIWRVLTETSGVKMIDEEIAAVVASNPGMTGRDIKNIIKLASLMEGSGKGLTRKMVKYVQQFKPTGTSAYVKTKPEKEYWWDEKGTRRLVQNGNG